MMCSYSKSNSLEEYPTEDVTKQVCRYMPAVLPQGGEIKIFQGQSGQNYYGKKYRRGDIQFIHIFPIWH